MNYQAKIGGFLFTVEPQRVVIDYPGGQTEMSTRQAFRGLVRMLEWVPGFSGFRMEGDFAIKELGDGSQWEFSVGRYHADTKHKPYAEVFPMGEAADFCRFVLNLCSQHYREVDVSPKGRLPYPGEFSAHYHLD